jgi:hypothetical protein
MPIEEWSKIINSVWELSKAVSSLKDIPKEQRNHYREILDETYNLIDSALLLIINRLGDIVLIEKTDRSRFRQEVYSLDNYAAWNTLERDVRLCRPLRSMYAEMRSMLTKVRDRISLNDGAALERLVSSILYEGEGSLAAFISESLHNLSVKLDTQDESSEIYKNTLEEILNTRKILIDIRRNAIKSQTKSFELI